MRNKIIRNVARCNFCGDVIESTYRHDFKTCRCGRVSVDGGHDYLRRCADSPDDYTDLSEIVEEEVPGASGTSTVAGILDRLTNVEDADPEEADEILRKIAEMKDSGMEIGRTHRFIDG